MGIGRDLNHPPTKWAFMLQILNSSRCPEKKGNCPVLSTCFFQLRFGFLKLKLQLNYPQANQHKKWDSPRFPPKFLPIQLPLFPTCKAAADSLPWRSNCSCEAKKKLPGLTVNIPSFVQQKGVFELGFQKIRSENFLGWKKNHVRHCAGLHANPFKHPPDAETELPCCGASLLCRPCRKRWAGEFAHDLVTNDPHSAVESIFS